MRLRKRRWKTRRWPGHFFFFFFLFLRCLLLLLTLFFFSLSQIQMQMTQGNVGSLLVFDPAKAGAAGSGGAVAPGDAVVGIVTERGELFLLLLLH